MAQSDDSTTHNPKRGTNQSFREQAPGSSSSSNGGASNNPGNFANDRERAREAGRKGGRASRGSRRTQ